MADSVRIEDLHSKIGQVISLVNQLKGDNKGLHEELDVTKARLEEAQQSLSKIPSLSEKVKTYEEEREKIKSKIERMIDELTALEKEEHGA